MKAFCIVLWSMFIVCFIWMTVLAQIFPNIFSWSFQRDAVSTTLALSFIFAAATTFYLLASYEIKNER